MPVLIEGHFRHCNTGSELSPRAACISARSAFRLGE
jgi:hypothetical protein